MPLEGSGKFLQRKAGKYNNYWVYLSKSLVKDSQFPFKANEELKIIIQKEKLIIEKK